MPEWVGRRGFRYPDGAVEHLALPQASASRRKLRAAQAGLQKVPVDDILGLLRAASREWEDPKSPFGPFHANGLAFLIGFIQRGGLQRMVDRSLRDSRGVLDDFRYDAASEFRWRALPVGVVTHWIAGNVPTLGFLSLLLSVATKNANILKVPEHVSPLLTEMLSSVARARYRTSGGHWLEGRVISDTIAALWYPHRSGDANWLSMLADARVVWGGGEAVRAVAGLPRKHTAQDIIFGPKLSVAAVGREALKEESRAASPSTVRCSTRRPAPRRTRCSWRRAGRSRRPSSRGCWRPRWIGR